MLVSDKSGTYIGLCLTDCIACRITRLRASYLPVPASQLRVTHVGLAWDSSPVASQHSYGGLSSGLPVSSLLWLGSESYFTCSELWSAIQSVPKSKNPSNNSGGLGSWREQQRTIESTQKYASCLTRPPQVSEGFLS
jgi:hypothetical protein